MALDHDLRAVLRDALDSEPAPEPGPADRLAAVLAPFIELPEPSLVLTVRSIDLSRHAGEISFPGGLQDRGETLRETALRESLEEIGLAPDRIEVVGALPPVHTFVSGILVVPFVGVLERAPEFTVSHREIDEVLTFPVARLVEEERMVQIPRDGGRVWTGYAYELEGHTIWGATGWMLHALLEVLRKEAPWLIPA